MTIIEAPMPATSPTVAAPGLPRVTGPAAAGAMTRIAVPARFDVHQVAAFTAQATEAPGYLVVDLGAVRFVDVAGLDALVGARAAALDLGYDLFVSGRSATARITLEMAGLAEALPLLDEMVVAA